MSIVIPSSEVLLNYIQVGIMFSVCSAVWVLLIVGLCQLIRDLYNRVRPIQVRISRLLPSHHGSH